MTVNLPVPVMDWHVALISASPAATAVTRPEAVTVAIEVLDDCHAAVSVQLAVVPLDKMVLAVN